MLQTIKRFIKRKSKAPDDAILSIPDQIESWRTANRKMAWGIEEAEFDRIGTPPQLTDKDRRDEPDPIVS